MKLSWFFLLLILPLFICAANEPNKVESKINTVTVFSNQAQIERSSVVKITKGKNEIHFTGLSPHIQKETIRVKGKGSFQILGISYINNYIEPLEDNEQVKQIKKQITGLELNLQKEDINITALEDQLEFLRNVNENYFDFDNLPKTEDIKQLNHYYADKFIENKTVLLELNQNYSKLLEKKKDLQKQLQEYVKVLPKG